MKNLLVGAFYDEYEGIYAGVFENAHIFVASKEKETFCDWDCAVEYCKTLGGGWTLPSKDELNFIWCQVIDYDVKDSFAFTSNYYWTSTEYSANTSSAWIQDFDDGYQINDDKCSSNYVRAVRKVLLSGTSLPSNVQTPTASVTGAPSSVPSTSLQDKIITILMKDHPNVFLDIIKSL